MVDKGNVGTKPTIERKTIFTDKLPPPRHKLPTGVEEHPYTENTLIVDPNVAYPAILEEIAKAGIAGDNLPKLNPQKPDAFWAEVAYQVVKMDSQVAMGRMNFILTIRADDDRKKRWNLTMLSGGDMSGVERATKGREAREVYRKLRGFIPG